MIFSLILSIVMTAVTLDSEYTSTSVCVYVSRANSAVLNWGLGKHMWDVPAMPNLSPWFMKVIIESESESVYKNQRLMNTAKHARCHLLLRRHRVYSPP